MYIAICDDETQWIARIEEYISEIRKVYKNIECDVFSSGEELLDYYTKHGNIFDVVILDIEMKKVSGIEVAQTIREKDNSVIIFFLTSHKEYVYDCFRPSPMNFWVKPVSYEQFKDDLERAYEHIEKSEQYIKVVENRNRIRIKCSDIIYIENKERKSWIYTTDGVYKVNKPLYELEKDLDNNMFIRVYKSIIINLAYIHIIGDNELKLYNCDELIPVSRTYKSRLIDSYIQFKDKEYF